MRKRFPPEPKPKTEIPPLDRPKRLARKLPSERWAHLANQGTSRPRGALAALSAALDLVRFLRRGLDVDARYDDDDEGERPKAKLGGRPKTSMILGFLESQARAPSVRDTLYALASPYLPVSDTRWVPGFASSP
jgi:hypothetical protein